MVVSSAWVIYVNNNLKNKKKHRILNEKKASLE